MSTTGRYWCAAFALSVVGIVPASSRAKVDMPIVDNKPTEYRFVMRLAALNVYQRAVPTIEEANGLVWAWQGCHFVSLLRAAGLPLCPERSHKRNQTNDKQPDAILSGHGRRRSGSGSRRFS
jgi:hypothetical protein